MLLVVCIAQAASRKVPCASTWGMYDSQKDCKSAICKASKAVILLVL